MKKNGRKMAEWVFIFILSVTLFSPVSSLADGKTAVIKFISPVNQNSVISLLSAIDNKMKEGVENFRILISTPGGSVFYGLTAYNYLRGIPANITTHNIGSVDSIGMIIYCGGKKRFSVPHARFLIHGIQMTFHRGISMEQPLLEERLESLKIDHENIAKVISTTIEKPMDEVTKAMLKRTVLNPQEAHEWGLVDKIESNLFEKGAEVITIAHIVPGEAHQKEETQNVLSYSSLDTSNSIDSLEKNFEYSSYPSTYENKSLSNEGW